jgi:concentrative nucleoside transporter, CNT family
MDRFIGVLGYFIILGIAYLMSNNRKAINWNLVLRGLAVQLVLAVFILKTTIGKSIFEYVGAGINQLLAFSDEGAKFVFGILVNQDKLREIFGPTNGFIFVVQIAPTIIFVAALVSMLYYLGIMQRVVSLIARGVHYIMPVSGAEALSNVASAFVGQVEAQIMIKPYIAGMTRSELLASMAGSMACIAGGVMAVYIKFGIPAEYLLAASVMAAPAALVISKMVYPETEESETRGFVKLEITKTDANILDALSHGANDGMKISINIMAMLIAVIAVVFLIDGVLGGIGSFLYTRCGVSPSLVHFDIQTLSLKTILGGVFSMFAWVMGVPSEDIYTAGSLMGKKMVVNEFVAYLELKDLIATNILQKKTVAIVSFALCGFANFSSVAMQIGGIGELAPSRRADLAKLGFKALICGTLASYLSATVAGILF